MSGLGSEILVARQLASLRHHGWSTLESAAFVAGSLPSGRLRTICEEAIQHLRSGAPAAPSFSHPLGQMVARGDVVSGPSFESLAEAWEAREAGQNALSATTRLVSILVAGPLLLGAVMGWLVPSDWLPPDALPAVTAALLALGRALRFIGLPLAIGGVWAVRRLAEGFSPGAREFRCAAGLLQFAAALEPGAGDHLAEPAMPLLPLEREYFVWRRSIAGAPVAARELAAESLRSGRRKAERFNQVAPIAGAFIAFLLFSSVISVLYLPLFKIAGSIR